MVNVATTEDDMNNGTTVRWHWDGTIGRVLFAGPGLFVIHDMNDPTRVVIARRDIDSVEVEQCVSCDRFVEPDEIGFEFAGREMGRDFFDPCGCVNCLPDEGSF